jgi:hypothetical protein
VLRVQNKRKQGSPAEAGQTKEETVKKLWLTVVLVALVGSAINSYADVQNIRISGDIRLRGYWLKNAGGTDDEDQLESADSFISQRTRVTVEADLEDHVLVVVTLKAEGLWGGEQGFFDAFNEQTSGAGLVNNRGNVINRGFDVGINEAYIQLNELFYTPATLKIGRQYLHYGHGLILSSVEQEYNFDAARLVLDFYPLTVDLVYATLIENSGFNAPFVSHPNDAHLLFANARYEMADSIIKNVEGYFGYLVNSQPLTALSRVPPSFAGGSPFIVGIRSDMAPIDNLAAWMEGAYEFGPDGVAGNDSRSAWLANVGARYTLANTQWSPAFNANYTFASGGGSPDGANGNAFVPWFDYVDGYNGYLFAPLLSNIHIFNLGASVKPSENSTVSVQGYYYLKADRDSSIAGTGIGAGLLSNRNVDFGGIGFSPDNDTRELGWEVDTIFGYDYSKDVRAQLVYAAFIPEGAFQTFGPNKVAHEVRGEINVKF